MLKHLTQHGNSAALIIDKAILNLLHIGMDTPLELVTDGKKLIISPVHGAARQKKFDAALKLVNQRHAKTLKKLAR